MGRPKAVQKSFWGTLGKLLLSKTTIVILALVAQAVLLIWLVIDLSQYAAYVYAGFLVLSALVILCIVNRDDNPDFRLVWMVPVAALPVVGAVIYLFVRLQLGTRLIRRRIAASDAAARRGASAGRKRRSGRPCAGGRGGCHRLSGEARLSGLYQYRLYLLPARGRDVPRYPACR